ncbi:MAG: U32 family peptidase [Oscillospiraceae bacterium]|nr:U32 family peptidase [Oscillospiraceae bacterium]
MSSPALDVKNKVPELLAPAGDEERLLAALNFGADAVYLAKKEFGMRAAPGNFDDEGLERAVKLCHERGVKVHLTCNTLPRNTEIEHFEGFIKQAYDAGIDAAIVADIGIMSLVKKFAPDLDIHMSTQTGIVNFVSANELYSMGAKRVVLARELSLDEIADIRAKTPKELEIECFVHGAMCVSFSGRCLISSYLTDRDANRGQCAQPCRWNYALMEEKREGQYFPVFEDDKGTYILNSKDMCMIDHIDKLVQAGITSFKIEGRAKSAYYVAVVTNAYRRAIDLYLKDPLHFSLPESIRSEVFKVSHRDYCTGFYFGHPSECRQYYADSGYIRSYDVCAVVEGCDEERIYCIQRNKFYQGDELEIMPPARDCITINAEDMQNADGEPIEDTRHAAMHFSMKNTSGVILPENTMIRKKV